MPALGAFSGLWLFDYLIYAVVLFSIGFFAAKYSPVWISVPPAAVLGGQCAAWVMLVSLEPLWAMGLISGILPNALITAWGVFAARGSARN